MDGRGSLGPMAKARLPSQLIKPDEPISGIRLSDWLHRKAHGDKLTARGFGTVFATACISRSRKASRRARAACSAARFRRGQAPIIRRLCLPMLGMPAYEEELFGPVASVIRADSENAAIATANDSAFGLGGGVITGDIARGERIAAEIESGNVFVNDNVRSDPRLPFGGVKQRGYGRELSHYGIREFVNSKTVVVG
jgi:hypothetical protein